MNTFKIGGVHPEPNKLTAGKKIETLALPKQAVFPLSQHIGTPAVPCVQKGDTVRVGTRIAEPGGFMSASIHSSVSGKVAKIDSIVDASGLRKPAIFIDVEGDEWEPSIDRSDKLILQSTKTREELLECIKNAGIVGMGGACFPTHVKLCPPKECAIDTLIINAVECEPYLTADHRLMLEYPDQIIIGIKVSIWSGSPVNTILVSSPARLTIVLTSWGVRFWASSTITNWRGMLRPLTITTIP